MTEAFFIYLMQQYKLQTTGEFRARVVYKYRQPTAKILIRSERSAANSLLKSQDAMINLASLQRN